MIKAIAIDDEPLALRVITGFCEKTANIELERSFTSQADALKYIRKYPVDIIFLDIQMPKKNGIAFYKDIGRDIPVIFTTAFHEYAIEGFNLNAVDYLLKPFTFERFDEAVKKAIFRLQLLVNSPNQEHLLIRCNYKLNKVLWEDIVYIQALNNYNIIFLKDGKRLTAQMSMKELYSKLCQSRFIRIHRSYIINANYIELFDQKNVVVNGMELPIGESFRDNLQKLI